MLHDVYLGLGSNLGDRPANLARAVVALPPAVTVRRASSLFLTQPWGYDNQPAFLNQVIQVQTALQPEDLLIYLKQLEQDLGRSPTFRYGPRIIDLDILFFDDLVVANENLVIPHPRLAERAFVLVPLLEIAPGLVHPGLGKTIQELASAVDAGSVQLAAI